nr:hypothetical protein GCM10020093_098020 [Planobispora longispora]
MFMRIDHVGIACHDLEEKIAFFERTFDLTVVAREVNEEQGVKEAMLHIADGEGAGPTSSSWSRWAPTRPSGSSWPSAARECTMLPSESPTSRGLWRRSAERGSASSTRSRVTDRWAPP